MEVILNDALKLICPEGFHTMTEEERSHLVFAEEGPGDCLSDPERHIIITLSWRKVGGLLAALAGMRDAARTMESRVAGSMKGFGYHLEGFVQHQIGGKTFHGFRYTYTAQGVEMRGESCIGKNGGAIYYLHFYARAASQDSDGVWNSILTSAEWLK